MAAAGGRIVFVGRATAKKLRDRGISTIGELAKADSGWLQRLLKSHGLLIWNYANGRDGSPVRRNRHPVIKSIGNSTTTAFDIEDRQTAHLVLLSLAETVAARLRASGYLAGLAAVSFRTDEFFGYGRQRKIDQLTAETNQIHQAACRIFDELWRGEPVRQIGLSAGRLQPSEAGQPALFEEENPRKVDRVVDAIREKFGAGAIGRASFLYSGVGSMIGGTGDISEYPMMSGQL